MLKMTEDLLDDSRKLSIHIVESIGITALKHGVPVKDLREYIGFICFMIAKASGLAEDSEIIKYSEYEIPDDTNE